MTVVLLCYGGGAGGCFGCDDEYGVVLIHSFCVGYEKKYRSVIVFWRKKKKKRKTFYSLYRWKKMMKKMKMMMMMMIKKKRRRMIKMKMKMKRIPYELKTVAFPELFALIEKKEEE